ncbi:MAG: BlaI/MecI/CopY family transcriptional regulator [Clostridia bacterium]|nr:BlaI/MecI/CopY family transcriptional regulator [Clostridia bacterium]
MNCLKLCESDYRFMCVVWDNEPLSSKRLVELCAQHLGWKKSTTYTVLKKMTEKGFAKNDDAVVSSLIRREEVQKSASEHFVEHTFQGSLPDFLTAFFQGKKLSEKEAAELKSLIDNYKEV